MKNDLKNSYKDWFSSDNFCCSMHISPSKKSHNDVIQLLDKFISSRLNKYLCGSLWRKLERKKQMNLFWFKEGSDIHNVQVRGYHRGSSFIRKELRMKSTEVQRHYHVLVRAPESVKNSKQNNYYYDLCHDLPTLVELTLKRIIKEYNSQYDDFLDIKIRNNRHDDKSQQYYATKEFGRNDCGENWGVI